MLTNTSGHPDSFMDIFGFCFKHESTVYHFALYIVANVPLVLPLCLYILRLGAQQWRSGSRISHTDVFTYNVVVVQLIAIAGSCLLAVNLILHSDLIMKINGYIFLINSGAVVTFQIFTCVERYLAVVHPVAYLGLRSPAWTLARNLSCVYVWLHCVLQACVFSAVSSEREYVYLSLSVLTACFVLVLFCNLCVLRALIRPGPGDGAKSSHKSKRRALNTITAITVALLFMLVGMAISVTSFMFLKVSDDYCVLGFSVMWFCLPSTMVLPLLFLLRRGKLTCFKTKT